MANWTERVVWDLGCWPGSRCSRCAACRVRRQSIQQAQSLVPQALKLLLQPIAVTLQLEHCACQQLRPAFTPHCRSCDPAHRPREAAMAPEVLRPCLASRHRRTKCAPPLHGRAGSAGRRACQAGERICKDIYLYVFVFTFV